MAKKDDRPAFIDMIRKKRLPVLILDNRWQQLFPPEQRPVQIRKLEDNLKKELKLQAKLATELKELQSLKKKLMQGIVLNMEEVSQNEKENKRKKKLEKSQSLIVDINDKIKKCLEQTDEMPERIRLANEELMLASVRICYEKMHKNEHDIKAISEWINQTRVELKRQVLIKQDMEDANSRIYSYMHDMLGPEFMQLFDDNDGNV